MTAQEPAERSPAEELLYLNHDIRGLEYKLHVAQVRRRWGNVLIAVGPVVLLLLWIFSGFSQFDVRSANSQIASLAGIIGSAILLKGIHYKLQPGGPRETRWQDDEKIFGERKLESDLELEVTLLRDKRKLYAAQDSLTLPQRRLAYKTEAFSNVGRFRAENRYYRRVQNVLQGVLIIGSLATTGIAGISLISPAAKWGTMVTSFVVGIASGFIGAFKYRERGAYLQQTADAIESEWEALELGVGRYKHYNHDADGQAKALADFVEEVHRLKTEQKKREQNLDQPPPEERSGSTSGG